jgi:hypothetical protein
MVNSCCSRARCSSPWRVRRSITSVCMAGEGLKVALAVGLGHIHGGIRIPQQLVGVLLVAADRDPDAGIDEHLAAAQDKGGMEAVQDPLSDQGRARLFDLLKQDGELIAAQPSGGIGDAGRSPAARPPRPAAGHQRRGPGCRGDRSVLVLAQVMVAATPSGSCPSVPLTQPKPEIRLCTKGFSVLRPLCLAWMTRDNRTHNSN